MICAERYHDISVGHRVYGHESKCAHLHGHNYRIWFRITDEEGLDKVGRVLDFSVIKKVLCMWLEKNWDHKFLLFKDDPAVKAMQKIDPSGVVVVPFNPTAENMAEYLHHVIGPKLLKRYHVTLVSVRVDETMKCSAISQSIVGAIEEHPF